MPCPAEAQAYSYAKTSGISPATPAVDLLAPPCEIGTAATTAKTVIDVDGASTAMMFMKCYTQALATAIALDIASDVSAGCK